MKNSVQKVTKCHVLNRGSRDRNEISARRIKNNKNKIEPFVLWNQNKQRESYWINFCNKKEACASFLLNGCSGGTVLDLLHAHRVSPEGLRLSRLNLLLSRLTSCRPSANPLEPMVLVPPWKTNNKKEMPNDISFLLNGSSGGTRTYNPSVNSRMLCHWATEEYPSGLNWPCVIIITKQTFL